MSTNVLLRERRLRQKFLKFHSNLDSGNKPEADMPVPDRLLSKRKSLQLLRRLKLSQSIGLLVYMNRIKVLSPGGQERLLYLQSKAPFSAIEAGLKFAQRLQKEQKLKSDFIHQCIELNRRPQSKRFRRYEVSRIGVGYRDKGTLPEESSLARRRAEEENFILLSDLPIEIVTMVARMFPSTMEGEWLDVGELDTLMKIDDLSPSDRRFLLSRK